MNVRLLASVFTVLLLASPALGVRKFWKGRRYGGNLGPPSKVSMKSLPLASADDSEDLWIDQLVDPFDQRNPKTYKQRYFVNRQFWNGTGPVFLMIGGEGEATAKWMHEGAWIRYAQNFGALCFQLEHRYYGKSHPFADLSLHNLTFLSSEQALADLAYFIVAMNKEYDLKDHKWIAFGGSYPGTLAAWLREKYPHLVHGAVSSSGPLLAQIDFVQYFEVVRASLATHSDECVTAVKKSFDQLEIELKHRIGQKSVNEKFNLCDPVEDSVDNALDMANLYENLAGNFAGVVQYNRDNSPHAKFTLDELCDVMVNETVGTPVDRLAVVNEMLLKEENEACLDFRYQKMIDEMRNESYEAKTAEGGRQWTFQTCTEFGFYQTSESPDSLFGNRFNVDFFIQQCIDIFGPKYEKTALQRGVNRNNIYYGALKPKTTNVIYVHGSIDPWHALGVTESSDKLIPTIFINGTAHCANMYEPRDSDPEDLKKARQEIEIFIRNILLNNF